MKKLTKDLPKTPSLTIGLKLITPPSPSTPVSASAMPGAPDVVPAPKEVNGSFRMWRQLSSGGFARAMGVGDIPSSRLLCLKVFKKTQLNKMARKRTKKYVCFAMDLMLCDLSYCMKNESGYCRENARRWSAQLALGINALHNMGIIHRDIKPENILHEAKPDFGLSSMKNEPKRPDNGTINFMAPEIPRNLDKPYFQKYGAPVDWWVLGCVLYELLSPPMHKARISSYLVVVLSISSRQALFGSVDDLMAYVAWNSKNYGKPGLYPAFLQLGPIAADLLVDILTTYFSNGDGKSEFRGAYSRVVQREEQSDMLSSLRDDNHAYMILFVLIYIC
ncbi:kinase-like domain-containing protein [Suillus occidentalis]|nr:kinase-like domain-containing protein [Suillus occidentalis]